MATHADSCLLVSLSSHIAGSHCSCCTGSLTTSAGPSLSCTQASTSTGPCTSGWLSWDFQQVLLSSMIPSLGLQRAVRPPMGYISFRSYWTLVDCLRTHRNSNSRIVTVSIVVGWLGLVCRSAVVFGIMRASRQFSLVGEPVT